MDKLTNSSGWIFTMFLVAGMLGAIPIALAGGSANMALWVGIVAVASYIKGKLEPQPGQKGNTDG